jgi:cell division transport system permease protein
MMRQLRILWRVVIEMFLGLKHSGWSNWLVISILAVALTIFGGVLQLTMTLKNVVSAWGSQLVVSAYLKEDADPKKVAREVSQFPEVQLVEIVPKDISWKEMQSSFKVAALVNPLPNTLHIHLTSTDAVEKIAPRIKLLAGIENVRYPLKVAHKINEFRHFLELAGIVVTGALSAATLIVIGNTIHLVIEARQREIEILSLTGVSHFYIKGPLILQGAAYGAAAAALAIGVLWGVHWYTDPVVRDQLLSFAPLLPHSLEYGTIETFEVMLGLGIAVGATGSAWTSGRYIKI